MKALADAGFRRVIYTVKHHDGFAMWQSRYTDFGVKASPWLGGEGDVVKMLAASAKKYGLELGLYISPADSYQEIQGVFANGSPKKTRTIPTLVDGDDRAGKDLPTFTYEATDYGALFLNQVYELMTEYGPIAEVWFDGAQGNTGRVEPYDFTAFYDLIEKLQPNALTAIEGEGVRWIGNEEGVARVNESSTIPTVRKPTGALKFAYDSPSLGSDGQIATAVQTQGMTELRWFPGEADFKMTQGWFAHPTDTPKTPAELLGLYNRSVGRNAVYLMNIPPTTTGSFAPASAQSLAGFGAERAKAYTKNVAIGAPVTVSDATGSTTTTAVTDGNHLTGAGTGRAAPTAYEVTLPQATEVNSIQLAEATRSNGQQVTGFTVEAEQNGAWIQVGAAGTIGASRIISFPSAVTASRFRVTVTGSRAPVQLSEIALYQQDPNATVAMSQAWLDCSAPTAGDGSQARPFNTVEQLRYVTMAPGSTLNVKAGADCGASTARLWGYGTADAPVTVALYGGTTAPRVGDVPLAEFLTPYVAQGWNLSGLTSPTAS
ncbi:alpha-L-fucosidase [Knoellia remsis]|uniref:alpha-L-fucosidase n=1 Tax=Knoellia remsis TaxID=407159 RepID=A0A2T0UTS6_9MICO|nr:alpha-L-fucosidase [Knoellia remsis]PRY61331.1 alpha-L-fucosidase [Knoellia remsis]